MDGRQRSTKGRRALLLAGFAASLLLVTWGRAPRGALERASSTGSPGASRSSGPAPAPRGAVLITIDTLRADHLGCYGYERATSPNIDRLATRSVRFANAVSTSSWTLPAHASILTGLYPHEHGVEKDITALPQSAVTVARVLRDHGFATFAAVSHVYLTSRWGFDNGFEDFDQAAALESPHRSVAGHIVDSALAWIDGLQDERRFFLWLHIFDPHWDYDPPEPFLRKFDPDYHGDMRGDYPSLKPYIKAVAGYDEPPHIDERDLEHVVARYDGEIAYVDSQIGRLLAGLDERGLTDTTALVLTADHGEEFMEHGSLEGHQWTLYDEVVMVPLLVAAPGRHEPRVVDDIVSTVGVGGTILDLLGVPADWRTLSPLLNGEQPEEDVGAGHGAALLELTVRRRAHLVALRTRDYKLIRRSDGTIELYDRPALGEHRNVADEHQDVVARLAQRLDEELSAGDRLAGAGAMIPPLDPATIERLRATGYLN